MTRYCRIWDVENKRKQKTVIVVKSKERGARTKVTACGYSTDGNLIGGGVHNTIYDHSLWSDGFGSVFGWSHTHVAGKFKLR
jgi:hypothetical protein